ncbi:haloacid dehalogenase-like hydrolase domain-containing protein 2 isoform X2 [Andrena cerasifolii]|uniref:haloacid dehalogenase-like hydrolase domain-containing protein 2 isoform X2 n=1 Tax=Andrena cerasifolii TaxID=2819439 RepID=UPI0040381862
MCEAIGYAQHTRARGDCELHLGIAERRREFLKNMAKQIRMVLIDLSGTLHVDNTAIPGAVEALNRLRGANIPVKFVTNTTKESNSFLHSRLARLGFEIKKEEIFSSLAAARKLIVSRRLNPLLLIDPAAYEDFEDLVKEEEKTNAVVVGLAPDKFHYDELNKAFRLLLEGAPLIAVHKGRYYKRPDGLALGPGAFVTGLEYSANVKAEVVGKPTAEFFKAALGDVAPEEAVMIGDVRNWICVTFTICNYTKCNRRKCWKGSFQYFGPPLNYVRLLKFFWRYV